MGIGVPTFGGWILPESPGEQGVGLIYIDTFSGRNGVLSMFIYLFSFFNYFNLFFIIIFNY